MNSDDIDIKLKNIDSQINKQKELINTKEINTDKQIWWSNTNAMTMSASILIFGIIVIAFATYLIRKEQTTESVLKIFGTILIIVIAVFLVVAGYSDRQIAPVMGLLGTIAGYLLGKDTGKSKKPLDDAP